LWFNEFREEYYHLLVVAIDKRFRGTGAFRELITPFLQQSDAKGIPIILETHNQSILGIYQHFGFGICQEFAADNIDFKQYCMIRNPDMSNVKENQNEKEG